jgi:putative ABC transport system permease protein
MSISRNTGAFWGETWQLAMQALRANKMRAMLTMLGVIIGSGSIVLVVTVALAGKRYVLAQIESVGANLVYANVVNSSSSDALTLEDQITPADLTAVKDDLSQFVVEAAGTSTIPMTVSVRGQVRSVNLVGVTQGFERIRNLEILHGAYFNEDDLMSRNKVCLLTEVLARRVFPSGNPVGKDVQIGELHFTVIGVFRERLAALGQTEISRESAIVPFPLLRYYTGTEYFNTLYAQADRPEDVPLLTHQVAEVIQGRHRRDAQYRVQNLTGILQTARNIALGLTVVLILIALIALVISGIGIMNIMLVTVTERTREIGIRKAIGASPDAIRYQFLMEALAISGMGALAGILIAIAIPVVLTFLIGFIPDAEGIAVPVSWVSVVVAFVVSSSTGLVFGFLPANRAARLQPTEALHHE